MRRRELTSTEVGGIDERGTRRSEVHTNSTETRDPGRVETAARDLETTPNPKLHNFLTTTQSTSSTSRHAPPNQSTEWTESRKALPTATNESLQYCTRKAAQDVVRLPGTPEPTICRPKQPELLPVFVFAAACIRTEYSIPSSIWRRSAEPGIRSIRHIRRSFGELWLWLIPSSARSQRADGHRSRGLEDRNTCSVWNRRIPGRAALTGGAGRQLPTHSDEGRRSKRGDHYLRVC